MGHKPCLDAAETRLDVAETRPDAAETRPDAAETRLDAAETRPDAVETWLDAAETWLDAAETRPDAAETRPDAAETRPDAVETRLDAAETRLDAAETQHDAADTRLDVAETRLDIETRLSATQPLQLVGECNSFFRISSAEFSFTSSLPSLVSIILSTLSHKSTSILPAQAAPRSAHGVSEFLKPLAAVGLSMGLAGSPGESIDPTPLSYSSIL